jgi:hypothetical protein
MCASCCSAFPLFMTLIGCYLMEGLNNLCCYDRLPLYDIVNSEGKIYQNKIHPVGILIKILRCDLSLNYEFILGIRKIADPSGRAV